MSITMDKHAWPVLSFLAIFVGYIISSSLLQVSLLFSILMLRSSLLGSSQISFTTSQQLYYYHHQREKVQGWKIQPKTTGSFIHSQMWWLPLLIPSFQQPQGGKLRAPLHNLFASINLIIASSFAAFTSYCTVHGLGSQLCQYNEACSHQHQHSPTSSLPRLLLDQSLYLLAALTLQSVLEYWWHILMHTRFCYQSLHKYHHFYTSPEPFDDMFIHPLEAFGYYCILYSPAFLLHMHVYTFLVYMSICGTFGIWDHSGIHLRIPLVYDTQDHDAHHSNNNCNYAFPFPYLDILHGTYTGTFAGKEYVARSMAGRSSKKHNE